MPVRKKNTLSMFQQGLTPDDAPAGPTPADINRMFGGGGGGTGGRGGGGGTAGGGGGGTSGGGGGGTVGVGGGGDDGGEGGGPAGGGARGGSRGDGPREIERQRRQESGAPGLTGSMLAAMSRGGQQRQQPASQTSSQTPRIEPEGFPLVGSAEIAEQLPQARSEMPSMMSRPEPQPRGGGSGLITGEPGVTLSGLDPSQAGAGLTGGGLGLPGGEAGVGTDAFRKMLLEILGGRG